VGFENHPVTYVNWYGAMAFCNYYGWRLPTEWEWQAVADYDGSYSYGHGPETINTSFANYYGSFHPFGTTVVGAYGSIHGYGMCDMAGNVFEWTTNYNDYLGYRVYRGGAWSHQASYCTVSYSAQYAPQDTSSVMGFRVCR
jgi:formylglycine-generating enzyme required for sulfatase activity